MKWRRNCIVCKCRACKIASPTSRGYCVFQSGYQNVSLPCPTGYLKYRAGSLKALKSFKYVKWYKKSLNCNFKRSYSWGWKGKNRDMAGLNFKRQLCHWINMSVARFKVKTRHGCLCECISEGNRLSSETCCWHFHLILPIKCLMKQRLWARCCFVYSRYRGNGPLYFSGRS